MARTKAQDAPAPQTTPDAPQDAPQEDAVEMVEGAHNPAVHSLLTQAQKLDDEKEALYKRIAANRDILRNYATTGLLSDEQATAIVEFYPVRQKKAGENGETPAST